MTFTLPAPAGFSLRAAADFAREFPGTRIGNDHTDAMSFAWTLDGDWRTASVVLRQLDNEISGEIDGPDTGGFTAKVRRDVERILCLDIDATDFPRSADTIPSSKHSRKDSPGYDPCSSTPPTKPQPGASSANASR